MVSLYPGLVRTEAVLAAGVFDLSNSESPEFVGHVVARACLGPARALERTGRVVIAAALVADNGLRDIDGRAPRPLTIEDV